MMGWGKVPGLQRWGILASLIFKCSEKYREMFQIAELLGPKGSGGGDWKVVEQHIFWWGDEVSLEWGRALLQQGREGGGRGSDPSNHMDSNHGFIKS